MDEDSGLCTEGKRSVEEMEWEIALDFSAMAVQSDKGSSDAIRGTEYIRSRSVMRLNKA